MPHPLGIINGTQAVPHSIPWQVSIGFFRPDTGDWWHDCGGTILNRLYILSAHHCAPCSTLPTYVAVKEHNIHDDSDGQTYIETCNWHTHPNFRPLHRFDIAVVSLKKPIILDAWAVPACLPTSPEIAKDDFLAGKILTVSGWGRTTGLNETSVEPDVLMTLDEIGMSNAACEKNLMQADPDFRMFPEMLCSNSQEPPQTPCKGDSGGPLTYADESGAAAIVGVVSGGPGRCRPGYAQVYSRVTSALGWIAKTIGNDVA